jgi:hypothetical protein
MHLKLIADRELQYRGDGVFATTVDSTHDAESNLPMEVYSGYS